MQSNRIQHFLFTNNLPSGLSYRTSILSSTVYYEGAEYPFLPDELPLFTQKYNNQYTPGGSSSCNFEATYKDYETTLGVINFNFQTQTGNLLDLYIGYFLDWAIQIGALTGVNLVTSFLENFWKFVEALAPNRDFPYLTLKAIYENILAIKGDLQRYYKALETGNGALLAKIKDLKARIAQLNALLLTSQSISERNLTIQLLKILNYDLEEATRLLRTPVKITTALYQRIRNIVSQLVNYLKFTVAPYIGGAIKLIAKLPTFLLNLVGIFVRTINVVALVTTIALSVFYTKQLFANLYSICDKADEIVNNTQAERSQAANKYYADMESLICVGGCCDITPCCGSSNSGSGSANGSCSKIQGFGLTLLMGEKYIPSYPEVLSQSLDQIKVGLCGFTEGCPMTTNKPDCTKYGFINGFTDPVSQYPINTWGPGCGADPDSDVNVPDYITLSCGVKIYRHKCACGWEEAQKPLCSWNTVEGTIISILESIQVIPVVQQGGIQ